MQVWSDAHVAARTLLRSPGFSLTALLTLVVGMSATTLALTAVNAVLLKPLSVRAPDRVVGITTVGELAVLRKEPVGFGDYADLARDVAAFESVVAHRRMGSVVGTGLDRRIAIGEQVSPDYFTTLGVSFPLGRPFDEADQPGAVVVLGHAAWRRHFGTDPRIIGRELAIGDRRRTVVGIAPEGFTGLFRGVAPEFWQPLDDAGGESADDRGQLEWWVHARLRDDATLEQARTQVAVLADTLSRRYPHSNAGRSFALTPLSEASIHPVVSKALARFGAAGVLAVALLLLLVCSVNVAHLVLARAVDGQREVAIRLAVGANRWRIIRPLLAEGILLTGVAAAIALLLTAWVGPMLGEIRLPGVPTAIDLHLVPDWRVFGLTVIVVLGSTMVSSLGPALRISSGLSIVKTLKTDSRASAAGGATTWRILLIAGQATTAVLLLVVGGLALRSLLAVTQVDPGFETRGVAVASVAPALVGHDQDEAYRYLSRAAAAVRELPNVEAAGWIQPVPTVVECSAHPTPPVRTRRRGVARASARRRRGSRSRRLQSASSAGDRRTRIRRVGPLGRGRGLTRKRRVRPPLLARPTTGHRSAHRGGLSGDSDSGGRRRCGRFQEPHARGRHATHGVYVDPAGSVGLAGRGAGHATVTRWSAADGASR